MHLSTEILEKICDLLASSNPSWPAVCKAVGISESAIWNWRARCIADRKREDTSSPFYVASHDEWAWWDEHCAKARAQHKMLAESIIRAQSVHGIEEVVRGPTQEIIYQKNPMYIGRPDSFVMFSEGCTEEDVAWHRLLHDENGLPQPEVVIRQAPSQLRLRVLEASHPDYVPRSHQSVDVQAHVVHEQKPLQRRKDEPRVDLQELRALAALTPEQRRAKFGASKYPLDANGRPTLTRALAPPSHSDPADDQHRGARPAPAPYVPPPHPAPQPQAQPRPSYSKPQRSMDNIGRGEPPPGGAPAWQKGNVR